jgi:hypothetical protein
MKTKHHVLLVLLLFVVGLGFSQDRNTSDKENIGRLVSSEKFEFVATTVLPMGQAPKNLVGSGYSVVFSSEEIISNMPFYGRGYSGMALGRDKGMRFKGKPEKYTIEQSKKGFEVNTVVKTDSDTFSISVSIGNSGYATLTISSNNRSTVSYQGEVIALKE